MVSDRIRELRKKTGLNQTEFGKRLGVTRSVILNIELKKVRPKELFLEHICEVYHASGQWLADGTGEMFEPGGNPNRAFDELWKLYQGLRPEFQAYLLKQINQLLELQNSKADS